MIRIVGCVFDPGRGQHTKYHTGAGKYKDKKIIASRVYAFLNFWHISPEHTMGRKFDRKLISLPKFQLPITVNLGKENLNFCQISLTLEPPGLPRNPQPYILYSCGEPRLLEASFTTFKIDINISEDILKPWFSKIHFWSQKVTCRIGSISTNPPVDLDLDPK